MPSHPVREYQAFLRHVDQLLILDWLLFFLPAKNFFVLFIILALRHGMTLSDVRLLSLNSRIFENLSTASLQFSEGNNTYPRRQRKRITRLRALKILLLYIVVNCCVSTKVVDGIYFSTSLCSILYSSVVVLALIVSSYSRESNKTNAPAWFFRRTRLNLCHAEIRAAKATTPSGRQAAIFVVLVRDSSRDPPFQEIG